MYATQSSRLGVPRHATVTPLRRRRRRPSTFASGFLLPSIVVCPLQERPVDATAVQRSNKREPSRANLTSGVISVSRSRFSAKSASERRGREGGPAWNPAILRGALSVDERTVIFWRRVREPAPDRALSSYVDTGGQVDNM